MHTTLRAAGISCLSVWADNAGDAEDLNALSADDAFEHWLNNRDGIKQADLVVVMACTPMREGFAEAEFARALNKAILWCGPANL